MATAAERQAKRRQQLHRAGLAEVTVTVPKAQRAHIRRIAAALGEGLPVSPRLIAALRALREARAALAEHGVVRAGIFGSVARGEDRADSDLDLVLVFETSAPPLKALMYAEEVAREAVHAVFPDVTVDVAIEPMLAPHVRPKVEREAVYAY
jgi:hypothetical protein